jgi:hypothetical protein
VEAVFVPRPVQDSFPVSGVTVALLSVVAFTHAPPTAVLISVIAFPTSNRLASFHPSAAAFPVLFPEFSKPIDTSYVC